MPLFIGHFACFVGVCASSCLNPRKTSVFPLLKPDFAFFTLLLPFSRFLRSKPPKVLCFGLFEPLFTLFSFFCFFSGKITRFSVVFFDLADSAAPPAFYCFFGFFARFLFVSRLYAVSAVSRFISHKKERNKPFRPQIALISAFRLVRRDFPAPPPQTLLFCRFRALTPPFLLIS